MKSVFLLAALVATVSAVPVENDILSEPKGWYVPTADGKLTWITKKDYEKQIIPESRRRLEVMFYLYTNGNPNTPKQLYLNDEGTLSNSFFNKSLPTRVIIHGWQGDYNSKLNNHVRNALLNAGNYNVISVDWSGKSKNINYSIARNSVAEAGKQVATFLDFLSTRGSLFFNNLALIGHSLGAHVAGFAGKEITTGKVNTIIGLDPAYPLFSYSDCSNRLCSSDAIYVESIQTCGGTLGFLEPIGKATFYPNGGRSQPGCGFDFTGSCAHSRSYHYYTEAIEINSFKSINCLKYKSALSRKCGNSISNVRMGTSNGNEGVFYVPVNKKAPYGTG